MQIKVPWQVVGELNRTGHQNRDNRCDAQRVSASSWCAETDECIRECCGQYEGGRDRRKRRAAQAGEWNGEHCQESSGSPHERTSVEEFGEVRDRGGQKEDRCRKKQLPA